MVLTTPDGAKHELRPGDYPTYPGNLDYRRGYYKDTPSADSINATMRYYTFDGSYLWAKIDPYPSGGGPTSWTVYLPDGTTVEQSAGIQRIKDTNGNKIKIWSEVAGTVSTTHYQDEQTGREIKSSYDSATSAGQVQYQTVGGTWISIDINWGTTRVFGQIYLSGDLCSTEKLVDTDIPVIRSIVLPLTKPGATRQQYTFTYNADTIDSISLQRKLDCAGGYATITSASHGWGSLSRMVTPQGAIVDYSYKWDNTHQTNFDSDKVPEESLIEKKITHDGVTDTWTYGIDDFNGTVTSVSEGSTTTETRYSSKPGYSSYHGGPTGLAGLVYRTNRSDKIVVERRWTRLIFSGGNPATPGGEAGFNAVVEAEYTTLKESGQAIKMSARTFQYDYNGNVTQETVYDWFDPNLVSRDAQGVPTSVPAGATVLRTTTNSYYNPATASTSANVYAKRTLPSGAPLILNAAQETTVGTSQTQFSYDNQAYGNPPTLGNLTKLSRWDSHNSKWLHTTFGYDSYGNRTTVTDPKNNVTTVIYDSQTHAQPTQVMVDPLNGTGQQTTATAYDYSTGRVTSQTDPNNQTTTIDYTNQLLGAVDPYLRPGIVTGPAVTSVVNGVTYTNQRHKVRTTYDDNLRQATVESDLNTENDRKLKTRTTSDQLGRVTLAERNEDGSSSYTISTQTVYVQMGKITMTAQPKRSGDCTGACSISCSATCTDGWTRATNDDLGRVMEIAHFGSATQPPTSGTTGSWTGSVTTSYNANQTTVTDQAGKTRRSLTDALGRLVQVIEDPNGLAYQTNHAYDALNNLTTVVQDTQTRTFVYDSLKRLTSATNPESGTTNYNY
jgi:YD repeat-containing protein